MALNNRIISNNGGSALILMAAMLPLLLIVMAVTIDIGRLYVVQAKAQSALDAALLGAVATKSTTPVGPETTRLFNANYPAGYMGSTVSGIVVTQLPNNVYQGTFTVTVPTLLVGLVGYGTVTGRQDSTLNILSQVMRGSGALEISLIMDDSLSMASSGSLAALQSAATTMVDALYGNSPSLPNTYVSLVPFSDAIRVPSYIFTAANGWLQTPYSSPSPDFNGCIAQRGNPLDLTDSAPTGAANTKFLRYLGPFGIPGLVKAWFDPIPWGTPPVAMNFTLTPMENGWRGTFIDPRGQYNFLFNTTVPLFLYDSGLSGRLGGELDYVDRDGFGHLIQQYEKLQIDFGADMLPVPLSMHTYAFCIDSGPAVPGGPNVDFPESGHWQALNSGHAIVDAQDFLTPQRHPQPCLDYDQVVASDQPYTQTPGIKPYRYVEVWPTDNGSRIAIHTCGSSPDTRYTTCHAATPTFPANSDLGINYFTYQPDCGVMPSQFFLSTKQDVINGINGFGSSVGSLTRTNVGLAWGWYVLSPAWRGLLQPAAPFLPLDYGQSQKVAVIMTQGANTAPNLDNGNFLATCNAMKAAGISLYTISFNVSDATTQSVLQSCASVPSFYFNAPTAVDLQNAFKTIADSVTTLRLVQ